MPKRPPEISASKWRGYSPSYKARLASFYERHPGASVQQARGHPKAEHVVRAERLDARIEALAARQGYRGSGRGGKSEEELAELFRERIAERGEGWLGRLERALNQLNERWLQAGKPYSHDRSELHENLAELAAEFDLDVEDLFYH